MKLIIENTQKFWEIMKNTQNYWVKLWEESYEHKKQLKV